MTGMAQAVVEHRPLGLLGHPDGMWQPRAAELVEQTGGAIDLEVAPDLVELLATIGHHPVGPADDVSRVRRCRDRRPVRLANRTPRFSMQHVCELHAGPGGFDARAEQAVHDIRRLEKATMATSPATARDAASTVHPAGTGRRARDRNTMKLKTARLQTPTPP